MDALPEEARERGQGSLWAGTGQAADGGERFRSPEGGPGPGLQGRRWQAREASPGEETKERRCPGGAPSGGLAPPERLRLELVGQGCRWGWEPTGEVQSGEAFSSSFFHHCPTVGCFS